MTVAAMSQFIFTLRNDVRNQRLKLAGEMAKQVGQEWPRMRCSSSKIKVVDIPRIFALRGRLS